MRYIQSSTFLLLACFILFSWLPSHADEKAEINLQKSYEQIKGKFNNLDKKNLKIKDLDEIQKENAILQLKMDECISANTTQLENAKKNLKLLGEKLATEEPDIINKRRELDNQVQSIDKELKRCTLLKIQLNQISDATTLQRQILLKKQLLSREFSLPSASKRLATLNKEVIETESEAILPLFEKIYSALNWPLLLLIIAGITSGILWRRYGGSTATKKEVMSSPTLVAALMGMKRTSSVLLASILAWLYLEVKDDSPLILLRTLYFTMLLLFTFAVVRGVVFPDLLSRTSNKVSRSSTLFLAWICIIFSVITHVFSQEAAGRFSGSAILYLVWLVSLSIAALSFIVVLWVMVRKVFSGRTFSTAYLIPMGAMLISIIAALAGFRNFSTLLFFGTLRTLIVLILAFLLLRISNEIFDSLDEGKIAWQHKLRTVMSIEDGKAFPGVMWLRILLFFIIVFISLSSLLFIWGSSQQQISTTLMSLKDGIAIGTHNFDLLSIFYAILILVVAFSLLPFIKNQLVSSWLKHSNLSRGAKDATQTLVGYGVGAFAVLWALYVLGMNFKNLAIIAGALSVGIGFGLQNIVNNFVSGIILLFERPIRRGDWVVVGETEGYVKDISIRSTTIQTFERADVIVPNSELISNQVTNWVLSNTIGRLKAPVGVAYGSDVSLVMETLEHIAKNHPEVISDHPVYPIRVLFLEFGDSSLNFELRCFIRNVDNRLTILSEINQGIDREFRKANIEIPFPQRVVYMQHDV